MTSIVTFETSIEDRGFFISSAIKKSFLEEVTFQLGHEGDTLVPWEQGPLLVLFSILVPQKEPGL